VALAWTTVGTDPETAFVLIQAAASQAATTGDVRGSAGLLEEFVARVPGHIPALSAYVQACVEGGLDDRVNDARGQLTDAYLSAGQAAEARDAAGDLIAREPWERAHMERFRRALVMLRIPDPDTVIADRLGGRTPFLATEIASSSASASASAATAYAPAEDTATSDPSPIGVADEAPVARSVQPGRGIPVSRLEPTDEGEIDLNSMLGGLEKDADQPEPGEPAAPSLGDAFKQVRQEVTRQGGVEASAQHMTLARTYLEMGLPDRAIEPLETAAESSQFRFEAASLLARIYMDRGDIDEAIEWLERAASVPAPTAEQGRSVAYDLALALEDRGESRRALAILLELQSEAGDYRDVADRIDLLSRHDGAAETETEG
jgi:tetratricopeptide (TPR) repeat protein